MTITSLPISSLINKLKNKEITAREVIENYAKNIYEKEKNIKAFINLDIEKALKRAGELDKMDEKKGLLFGVPVAVKDNMNVKNCETTAGSQILKGYISPYNATVVKKLKEENAIIIGKTNMDEFAMGSSNENSSFFPTHNPVNYDYVPGGSSGGSAASVKSEEVLVALGSDTGGSVREPAAFCGVVGLKPTYGLVSRYGLIAFSSSLDQIGPLTRNVKDCAIMLNAIAGFDPHDETSVNIKKKDYTNLLGKEIKGKRIGIIKEVMEFNIQDEIKEELKKTINTLVKLGVTITEISIAHLKYALPAYYIVAPSEASSNLSRFDGVRYGLTVQGKNLTSTYELTRTEGFGEEVKRRILIGTFALSAGYYDAYYLKASKVRKILANEFEKAFETVDTLLLPTTATTAFKLGEKKSPLEMYMSDIFTIPVNLAGLPAISVPHGSDKNGLPIGMQLIGSWFKEKELLQIAYAVENG